MNLPHAFAGAGLLIALLFAQAVTAERTALDVAGWKGSEAGPAEIVGLISAFETANLGARVEFTFLSRLDIEAVSPPHQQGNNTPDQEMSAIPGGVS